MKFEFDPNKDRYNQAKHGVSFAEAETAVSDPFGFTGEDITANGEHRFITLGMSALNRLLVVVWTPRGEIARLISAWKANPQQRKHYEQDRT